jgi:2-enoate reductase
MKKLNIDVFYEEATVDTIMKGGFDAAIVANGALPVKLDIPGMDKPHVYEALDITGGKEEELGNTLVVIGGGVLACEIAISQARKGKRVIMTAPEGCFAGEYEIGGDSVPNRLALMEELKERKVEINLCLIPKEITDNSVISVGQDGKEQEFMADSIIVCRGFMADKSLTDNLKGKIKEVRSIGDCVESRLIYEAIHEGWVAANHL